MGSEGSTWAACRQVCFEKELGIPGQGGKLQTSYNMTLAGFSSQGTLGGLGVAWQRQSPSVGKGRRKCFNFGGDLKVLELGGQGSANHSPQAHGSSLPIIGTQSHLFLCVLSMAAFMPQWLPSCCDYLRPRGLQRL